MRLDLTGPSVNPHWHVPGSIHSLIGEIYVARRIFDLWQPYLRRRLDEHHSHTYERGVATSLIIQAGLITERSLKSLIAQTQPKWEGTYEHDLWVLYSLLRTDDRIRIQTQFEHPTFATQWRRFSDPNDNIAENIIKIAKRNFTDWRYTMERSRTSNGVPGPLLKVAAAVNLVSIWHLLDGQESVGVSFPIDDLPFNVIGELK